MSNELISPLVYAEKPLKIYFYYRLALGALLYVMFVTQFADSAIGKTDPGLFSWTCMIYIFITATSFFMFPLHEILQSTKRMAFILGTDLIAITLIIHSSGGITSGLGYLLLVSIATASILVHKQIALAFAAIATFFIFGEVFFSPTQSSDLTKEVFSAGILGIFVFLTSSTFLYLTDRIQASNEATERERKHSKHLEELAQHIVQRMQTGIAVIDENNRIELINESAIQQLELNKDANYYQKDITEEVELKSILEDLEKNSYQTNQSSRIHRISEGRQIRIGLGKLETGKSQKTILFFEDYRSIVQQAQQLKLASLGRLTASIAHEIRNPLGSISHAAQLLNESEEISEADSRFIQIILQNSIRVNQIVENTSILSRRKEPDPEVIDLTKWLPEFTADYSLAKPGEIRHVFHDDSILCKMDPSNLRQILTNLLDNGLRYSEEATGNAVAELRAGNLTGDDTSYLEIVDYGKGVDIENYDNIFEPFYTTDKEGSGLGLYICKELCEINQATLNYKRTEDNKSCFRINFPHYQRLI